MHVILLSHIFAHTHTSSHSPTALRCCALTMWLVQCDPNISRATTARIMSAERDHDQWPMTPIQEWCNALSMLGPAGVCIAWLIARQTAPGSYETILAMVCSHCALSLCSLTVLSHCVL